MSGHVALSEDELACGAVNTVRTNDSICCYSRAVLEVENHAATLFLLDRLDTLVEVCTFGGHFLDEFIEEMSAMYASHAAFSLLGVDQFVFVLAFALVEEECISLSR